MSIKIGDKVPSFAAIDSSGNHFEIRDFIGKSLIIYFYPKDDTPGCTAQACSFRDNFEQFKSLDAEIIGISSDSVKSHKNFSEKYNLPFILLSDNDKKLRKLFGVTNDFLGLIPGRTTYIIDKNGIVQFIFDSISSKMHIEKALEFLKINNL